MPTQKKGCDDDEIVGLFSPQRRLFRKSKAAVLFRAKVSYRLMYILHESAMTPTHSSLGILRFAHIAWESMFQILFSIARLKGSRFIVNLGIYLGFFLPCFPNSLAYS